MGEKTGSQLAFTVQVLQAFGWKVEAELPSALPPASTLLLDLLKQHLRLLELSSLERLLVHSNHVLLRSCLELKEIPVEQWPESAVDLGIELLDWWLDLATQEGVLEIPPTPASEELWFLQTTTEKGRPHPKLLEGFLEVLLDLPVFYSSLSVQLSTSVPGLETVRNWTPGEQRPFQELGIEPEAALELLRKGVLSWVFPASTEEPGWASKLYQYLGFLEGGSSNTAVAETAFWLQWLRTAVRTLPFQEPQEAMETLQELHRQLGAYFEKYGKKIPDLRAEQLIVTQPIKVSDKVLFEEQLETLRKARLTTVLAKN